MDRKEYDNGYEAAKQSITAALKNISKGNDQNQNGGSQGNQGNMNSIPGMDMNINPGNNGGSLSQKAQAAMNGNQGGQQGGNGQQGQGGQQGGSGISVPTPGAPGQQQGGNGQGKDNIGGSMKTSASREARAAEVSKLGGAMISTELGEKIARESGYSDRESGGNTNQDMTGKWGRIAKQMAAQMGIGSGKGSGLLAAIESIYTPKVNWKAELKNIAGHALGGPGMGNAWGRKAFLQYDEIRRYDKPLNDNLSNVFFMIDTSGSVGVQQLMVMLSEATGIVKSRKIPYVTVISYGDGVVYADNISTKGKLTETDIKKLKLGFGGGTNFEQSLDDVTRAIKDKYIKVNGKRIPFRMREGNKADLVMIFTDGDSISYVSEKPRWMKNAVFLVCADRQTEEPKFGKVIKISPSDI